MFTSHVKIKIIHLNVTGETKYLANMQSYTACHRKYHDKKLIEAKDLLWVVGRSDYSALLVMSSRPVCQRWVSCILNRRQMRFLLQKLN